MLEIPTLHGLQDNAMGAVLDEQDKQYKTHRDNSLYGDLLLGTKGNFYRLRDRDSNKSFIFRADTFVNFTAHFDQGPHFKGREVYLEGGYYSEGDEYCCGCDELHDWERLDQALESKIRGDLERGATAPSQPLFTRPEHEDWGPQGKHPNLSSGSPPHPNKKYLEGQE